MSNSKNYKNFIIERNIKPIRFFGLGLFFVISSYLFINFISDGNITYRYLGETITTLSGEKIKTLNTITTGRYELIKSDLSLWMENFFLGTGAGSSKYLRNSGFFEITTHTEVSRLLSEHGLFGFFFIFLLIYNFLNKFLRNHGSIENSLLAVLFFIGIGTMLHSGMRTYISPLFISLSTMSLTISSDQRNVRGEKNK